MTETHKPTETHDETVTDAATAADADAVAVTEDAAHTGAEGPEADEAASLESLAAAWRDELGEEGSVSATDVQDRLLDLWATLPEGAARSQVERWLTETLARHLYAVDDVQRRLETVLAAD